MVDIYKVLFAYKLFLFKAQKTNLLKLRIVVLFDLIVNTCMKMIDNMPIFLWSRRMNQRQAFGITAIIRSAVLKSFFWGHLDITKNVQKNNNNNIRSWQNDSDIHHYSWYNSMNLHDSMLVPVYVQGKLS